MDGSGDGYALAMKVPEVEAGVVEHEGQAGIGQGFKRPPQAIDGDVPDSRVLGAKEQNKTVVIDQDPGRDDPRGSLDSGRLQVDDHGARGPREGQAALAGAVGNGCGHHSASDSSDSGCWSRSRCHVAGTIWRSSRSSRSKFSFISLSVASRSASVTAVFKVQRGRPRVEDLGHGIQAGGREVSRAVIFLVIHQRESLTSQGIHLRLCVLERSIEPDNDLRERLQVLLDQIQ